MMIYAMMMNIFMGCVLMALFGSFTLGVFLLGLVIGALLITVYSIESGRPAYIMCLLRLVRFGLYFLRIMIVANFQVAWEIITPGYTMTPGVIRYPVAGMTPVQITTLANCITLTPGTLSTEIDEQTQVLYIHGMYMADHEKALAGINELRDRLMREVFQSWEV